GPPQQTTPVVCGVRAPGGTQGEREQADRGQDQQRADRDVGGAVCVELQPGGLRLRVAQGDQVDVVAAVVEVEPIDHPHDEQEPGQRQDGGGGEADATVAGARGADRGEEDGRPVEEVDARAGGCRLPGPQWWEVAARKAPAAGETGGQQRDEGGGGPARCPL